MKLLDTPSLDNWLGARDRAFMETLLEYEISQPY